MIGKLLSGAAAKVLAALDSPATGSDIVLGKEAYNSNGDKITGTLESINNPWKPSSQSEYDTIVASKNKVGNYIEYSGKTTKVMPEVFSGAFNIGDTVTDVWFDTSITPSTPFFTEWDVTGISYNSKYYRVKYLMVGDGTWTFGDATLKQGIMIIANESDAYAWSIYYGYPYGEDMFIYSNSASDFLLKGWIFDYNTELETKVTFDSGLVLTTLLSSGYSWNGYFAFKNRNAQYSKEYYSLSKLSTPATAKDILSGKQAYNDAGERIRGKYEPPQNPWAPSTESEYTKLLVPNNVGNFFDYDSKITRLESVSFSDSLAVNDSITNLYFDTTKTPTIPDFSSGYEEFNGGKLIYLFKTSAISEDSLPDCGLFWAQFDSFVELQYVTSSNDIMYIYGPISEEDPTAMQWMLDMNTDGNPIGFTLPTAETITSLNSDYNWDGIYVFKNKATDIAEYQKVGGGGNYTVKVIDYDGTVLLEKKGNTGDVIDLPTAPTHENLVFQEWSASVAVYDNKVTIADSDIMVGAVYTTASGQNEFDITLTKVAGLSVTLNMDGIKDWGDGTSDTATSHTYTAYGDYTIKCGGTKMTTSESSGLFGQSSSSKNYYCTEARFATVTSIGTYAFVYCYSLTSIAISNSVTNIDNNALKLCYALTNVVIPNSVTNIDNDVFNQCYSLTSIVIPNSVTSIGNYAFNYCSSLTSVVIPNSVTSIGIYAFYTCSSLTSVVISNSVTSIGDTAFAYCYSLTSVVISNSVTSIGGTAFAYCYSLTKYDFSQHTSVPTLSNTNAFANINNIAKIIVPDSLYDSWIAASNWSSLANYIYKASEAA